MIAILLRPHSRRAGRFALILTGAACLLSGCLSRPALRVQSFALQTPSPASAERSGTNTLALKGVTVAPAFEGLSFVYRTGDQSYERDPYAEFLVPPARLLQGPLVAHLRNGRRFRDAWMGSEGGAATHVGQVHVSQLYGDFSRQDEAVAVLTLRIVIHEAEAPQAAAVWQREVSRRIPLAHRTAASLAAGWDKALNDIMSEINSGLEGWSR